MFFLVKTILLTIRLYIFVRIIEKKNLHHQRNHCGNRYYCRVLYFIMYIFLEVWLLNNETDAVTFNYFHFIHIYLLSPSISNPPVSLQYSMRFSQYSKQCQKSFSVNFFYDAGCFFFYSFNVRKSCCCVVVVKNTVRHKLLPFPISLGNI